MSPDIDRLLKIKRASPALRETELMESSEKAHPLVEKVARAISDWHSESDWPLHTDQAIRAIEAAGEYLGREGFRDAQEFLSSGVWKEPKPRKPTKPAKPNAGTDRTSRLYF